MTPDPDDEPSLAFENTLFPDGNKMAGHVADVGASMSILRFDLSATEVVIISCSDMRNLEGSSSRWPA